MKPVTHMAPLTRKQRRQSSNTEPLQALPTDGSNANATENMSNHVHFGSDDDDEVPVRTSTIMVEIPITRSASASSPSEISADDLAEQESDDDPPEAVTIVSGKEAAKKFEKDASRAIEAQNELAKNRRKRKTAILKDQREKAAARKRQKLDTKKDEMTELSSGTEASENLSYPSAVTLNDKIPSLLPHSLLKKVSSHPSPQSDVPENLSMNLKPMDAKIIFGKKSRDTFKRGPVKVKVLKNEAKASAVMAPPAVKNVVHKKMAMFKGKAERRSVGNSFTQSW
ncbi:hypothetical protein EDC01DRAFT_290757 [Geopyxis carbonaria]|nr:hypothetical protein EDC01DRAFT_290757 [Geopyxis carbonaria]